MSTNAHNFIRLEPIVIEPRKRPPHGIDRLDLKAHRLEEGHALTRYGDPGWGELVQQGKYRTGRFDDDLVVASVKMIERWNPSLAPTWLTAVPSHRVNGVVVDFARRLADALGIEFVEAVERVRDNSEQKMMHNSYQQARNVLDAFRVQAVLPDPVLLIDDIVDSSWTLTVIGNLLMQAGSGAVYPFALADAGKG